MGSYMPYGATFKINHDLYSLDLTTLPRIKIPLPSVPKSTINFAVPVSKKGSPPDLKVYVFQLPIDVWPDIRNPTKEFTFAASNLTAAEKIITFSMDIDTSSSDTPNWLVIYFALPPDAERSDQDYYMLRWITGGAWGITEDMISMFSINYDSMGNPVVPVVGGIINFSDEIEYWTTTSNSAFKYPYGENPIVLLGGKSLERSDLSYAFEDYWGILIKFAGEILLELYYGNSVLKNRITSRGGFPPGSTQEYDEISSNMLLFSNSFADYLRSGNSAERLTCLFSSQFPQSGTKLTKIKITALSPYVHLTDFRLIGKTSLEIKKKITDIDPTSTSIDDYGLCPDSEGEREFSSKDEMNEYVNNLLLTNSKPLVSLTITYPYVTTPSLPSTMSLSIPEIQEDPFTLKVIGCDWDLDNRTTDLIFEAAPLNYLVQALKSLQNKVGG